LLIDLRPADDGMSRTACSTVDGVTVLALWSCRRPGRGEDAPPTFLRDTLTRRALLAVYDGLGGSGARAYPRAEDGSVVTEAYVAARVARTALEEWFRGAAESSGSGWEAAKGLTDLLAERLQKVRNPLPKSRVEGTLKRELPTTMAALEIRSEGDGRLAVRARWAGDSRAYLLDGLGLRQLTRDHSKMTDGLEILLQNPPMSNFISLGKPFSIDCSDVEIELPAILLCATDGCFGYVETPALFEHMLLETLRASASPEEWLERLREAILGFTQDDASMVVAMIGHRDFESAREDLRDRAEHVRRTHWEPYVRARGGDERDVDPGTVSGSPTTRPAPVPEALAAFRLASWETYRSEYSRLMPNRGADA
jgi:serine/threonine protein phosphatase PrpC